MLHQCVSFFRFHGATRKRCHVVLLVFFACSCVQRLWILILRMGDVSTLLQQHAIRLASSASSSSSSLSLLMTLQEADEEMATRVTLIPGTCVAPGYCQDEHGFYHYVEQINPLVRHHGAASSSSSSSPSSWTEHYDHYQQQQLQVRHRTHAGVETCLANQRVVLIGDSSIRNSYMVLAYFLKTGKWLRCTDQVASPLEQEQTDPECFLIHGNKNRDERMNWAEWYRTSNQALHKEYNGSTHVGQAELCDCYGPRDHHQRHESAEDRYFQATVENRHFRRKTLRGQTIQLTYLQSFDKKLRFHKDRLPPWVPFELNVNVYDNATMTNLTTVASPSSTTRCDPGYCDRPPVVMPLTQGLIELVPRLNPTHMFVNAGWNDDDISCSLHEFAKTYPNVSVIYVSPPARRNTTMPVPLHNYTSPGVKRECRHDGDSAVPELDRVAFTVGGNTSWYVDHLHHASLLNQVFAEKVLDHICGDLSSLK